MVCYNARNAMFFCLKCLKVFKHHRRLYTVQSCSRFSVRSVGCPVDAECFLPSSDHMIPDAIPHPHSPIPSRTPTASCGRHRRRHRGGVGTSTGGASSSSSRRTPTVPSNTSGRSSSWCHHGESWRGGIPRFMSSKGKKLGRFLDIFCEIFSFLCQRCCHWLVLVICRCVSPKRIAVCPVV